MPVVPTDQMQAANTSTDTSQPILDLIEEGLRNRPELLESDIDLANRQISRQAARNALLPSLALVGFYGGSGLGGSANPPGIRAVVFIPPTCRVRCKTLLTIRLRIIMWD